MYVPTAHNVPMFSGKGEFQGSVGLGIGLNVQTAYAVTDHIVVAANYLYANYSERDFERTHQTGEIAMGYFTTFNEQSCFEVFAGYALGKGHAFDSSYFLGYKTEREAAGQYHKIFIQPSIGKNRGNLTWAISTKFSYSDCTEASSTQGEEQLWKGRKPSVFCSLVGNIQTPIWRKKIFIRYQGGFNFHISKVPVYDYDPIVASIGLLVKLRPNLKSD